MSSRRIKQKVLQLLEGSSVSLIHQELNGLPVKDVVNTLFSAICRDNEMIHWNGVQCMGTYVARMADHDMEEARIIMRRLLWSLNDESGGIGWGAPEAMGEIMSRHERLADEYVHMLISYMREDGEELFQDGNYLEHEVLQRGLLWGVGRLAETRPDLLLERNVPEDLLHYLGAADATVRGLAARNLGLLRSANAVPYLQGLVDDHAPAHCFVDGRVQEIAVSDLAGKALSRIISLNGKG